MNEHQAQPGQTQRPGEISLYTILRVVLQQRYIIVGAGFVVAFFAVVTAFGGARSFTAEASFIPQSSSRGASSGLAALAGQFGMSLDQAGQTESPQFYVALLGTREVHARLLSDTFSVAANPRTGAEAARGTLADLFEVEAETEAERRERTLRRLSKAINVTNSSTGMVDIAVTTRWADLSAEIAERLIELVNEFNLNIRQTQAAAESQFVGERIKESEAALREAERELRAFLESNRQFQNSPELLFEYDRLQQRVQQQRELYASLQESLQSASIARVRDTPLITVITSPEQPVYPDSRRIPLRAVLGMLLGATVGLIIAFGREFLGRDPSKTDPEYQGFRRAWSETIGDLNPFRGRARSEPGS